VRPSLYQYGVSISVSTLSRQDTSACLRADARDTVKGRAGKRAGGGRGAGRGRGREEGGSAGEIESGGGRGGGGGQDERDRTCVTLRQVHWHA